MHSIRVLIVDDHAFFREGLRGLLRFVPQVEVVGEAASGAEAVDQVVALQPDVIMMDLHMPELNGIDATARILATSPHIAILVLTMFEDDDSVFAAMRSGARGYLLKGADREEIGRAIHAAARGEALFSPAIAQRMMHYFASIAAHSARAPFPQLSDREREVLDLIAGGLNNGEIAERLVLSAKTVRNHVSNIFAKLQVADRAQAIIRARDAGLGQRSS
jgi:DNA-binding NarL/FixJ family response regulator